MTRNLLLVFFTLMLVSMLLICIYAGSQQNMFTYFKEQGNSPWFLATLLDCDWGFFIFYGWLMYKEKSWFIRIPSFLAICSLGNIAIASYGLFQAFRLPNNASFEDFLLKRNNESTWPTFISLDRCFPYNKHHVCNWHNHTQRRNNRCFMGF